jgi:hypothetical protein
MNNNEVRGMATESQLTKIKGLVTSPEFRLPLASLLKSITGGTVSSLDELTGAQAKDVLSVLTKKLKK